MAKHQAIIDSLREAGYVVARTVIIGARGIRWYHRLAVVLVEKS